MSEATFDFSEDELLDEACREFFLPFLMISVEVMMDEKEFQMNWHIDAMCHQLGRIESGDITRLIFEMPPRHFKSLGTSVAFTAWMLGRNPATEILVASYSLDLAEKHARDTRTLMNSTLYKRLFPNTKIKTDTKLEITTTSGGIRKAVSIGGSVTGFGADLIIVDDLMKAGEANSEAELKRVRDFYDEVLVSRLNNTAEGKIVVIQQRLAESDLVGYLREKNTFNVSSFPVIAQIDEIIPLSRGDTHVRRKGDLLFAARQSHDDLEALRREIGETAFSAQFLQNPTAPGGNRVRWSWFGQYDFEPSREMFEFVVQTWDCGFTEQPTSDFSVCMTWGFREGKWLLIDIIRRRLAFYELLAAALAANQRWKPDKILIERAANGYALFSNMFQKPELRRRLIEISPKNTKEERLEASTSEIEAGKFLLPVAALWLPIFEHELSRFPVGKYDDQVDAFSQFVEWQRYPARYENGGRQGRPKIGKRPSIRRR